MSIKDGTELLMTICVATAMVYAHAFQLWVVKPGGGGHQKTEDNEN
jgi:hypothetical protein